MATAAAQEPRRALAIALPVGEGGNKRAFANPTAITPVQLVVEAEDGVSPPTITDLGELPLGTKELYTQHRMCGDYYCFIGGTFQVSATGSNLVEAFKSALKRAVRAA